MKDNLAGLSPQMSLPVHPTLVYPQQHRLAGAPLEAVGVVNGRPIWPIMGGNGAGEDGQNGGAGTGDGDGANGGAGGSNNSGGTGGTGEGDAGGDPAAKIRALEEEKDRHFRKRQEAETELEDLRKFKKEAEDKGKTETQRLESERDEAVKAVEKLNETNSQLLLQIAFLSDNTFTWQNPKRALQLADLSEVEIKDGKVTGLDRALEALSKSDPYLLKPKDDEGNGSHKSSSAGSQHNGKKGSKDKDASEADKRAALLKKYPALRR